MVNFFRGYASGYVRGHCYYGVTYDYLRVMFITFLFGVRKCCCVEVLYGEQFRVFNGTCSYYAFLGAGIRGKWRFDNLTTT